MNRRQFLKSLFGAAVVAAVPLPIQSLLASVPVPKVDPIEVKARQLVKDTLTATRKSHGPIIGDMIAEEDINVFAFISAAIAQDEQAKVWSMAHRRFGEFAYGKAA